jgi:hypothetical protein
MPVAASDLVAYHSANNPDDDVSTVGGAIDTLRRPDFSQVTAGDTVEVISDNAGDTQNCTIEARKADGSVVSETLALTGTTAKIFTGNGAVDRILKVELASAAVGTITVRKSVAGATYRDIPVGERGFSMPFRKTTSVVGLAQSYYAKIFVKNTNGSLALTSSIFKQSADPDARITHLPAASADDSATSANRLTTPAVADTLDPDVFDDNDKTVGTIGSGSAWGVWLELALPDSDTPHRTTYTLELDGQSA